MTLPYLLKELISIVTIIVYFIKFIGSWKYHFEIFLHRWYRHCDTRMFCSHGAIRMLPTELGRTDGSTRMD